MTFIKTPVLVALLCALAAGGPACAQTIIDDWAAVRVPAPPELKPVTVDPRTTALLVLDFNGHEDAASGPCNAATRPRCLASIPKVRRLLDAARSAGALVVFSTSASGTPADIRPGVAPAAGEPVVKSGPDKFVGTDLGDLLGAARHPHAGGHRHRRRGCRARHRHGRGPARLRRGAAGGRHVIDRALRRTICGLALRPRAGRVPEDAAHPGGRHRLLIRRGVTPPWRPPGRRPPAGSRGRPAPCRRCRRLCHGRRWCARRATPP